MEMLNVGNLNLAASRIRILIVFIFIFFLLFAARLIQIQAIQASDYRNKAANEMESTRAIPAARGEITDINGIAFARSVSAINIVVDQTLITDAAQTANFAAPYLGMTVEQVQAIFGLDYTTALAFGWTLWLVQTLIILIGGIVSFVLLPLYNTKSENNHRYTE